MDQIKALEHIESHASYMCLCPILDVKGNQAQRTDYMFLMDLVVSIVFGCTNYVAVVGESETSGILDSGGFAIFRCVLDKRSDLLHVTE